MKVGFVGLGLMGLPMAMRLIEAGFELVVLTGNATARTALVARGARTADSISAIVSEVDVFCSCRVTPQHSLDVFLGADGVATTGRPGLLCIDFATIDPGTSRRIGEQLAERRIGFLDAPISGGPDGAKAGVLNVIVGGAAEALERARPVFAAFAKRVFHMGAVGTGVTAKLCNNMITITSHVLVAEAMVLGAKSGIDADALYEVLRSSSAYSRSLERAVAGHILPRDFDAAATIDLVSKDLACAIETGKALGVRLLLPAVALQCYVEAAGLGHAEKDIAAVVLPMEAIAGVRVGGGANQR